MAISRSKRTNRLRGFSILAFVLGGTYAVSLVVLAGFSIELPSVLTALILFLFFGAGFALRLRSDPVYDRRGGNDQEGAG